MTLDVELGRDQIRQQQRRSTEFLAEQLARAGQGSKALEVLDRLYAEAVREGDAGRQSRMDAYRTLVRVEYPGAQGAPRSAVRSWHRVSADEPVAGAADALAGVMNGIPAEVIAARAEETLSIVDANPRSILAAVAAVRALVSSDRYPAAAAWCLELARQAGRLDAPAAQAEFLAILAKAEYRMGDLRSARSHLLTALARMPATGFYIPREYAVLVLAKVDRMSAGSWHRTATAGPIMPPPTSLVWAHYVEFRGHIRMAQGQPSAALEDFMTCGRFLREWNADWPAVLPWRAAAAGACAALGNGREASKLAHDQVELARRSGGPRLLGVSLRRAAAVTDGPARMELLSESGSLLEAAGAKLEVARTLAATGVEMHRRGDRDAARRLLNDALRIARLCGAGAVQDRVAAMLVEVGRPRRAFEPARAPLTVSQQQVVRLAAAGRSNRCIAADLSITLSTVKQHLTEAYRKLGITRRAQLERISSELLVDQR